MSDNEVVNIEDAKKKRSKDTTPISNVQKTKKPRSPAQIANQFQPGNSASPGRPRGSRNKFQENFGRELCAAFDEGGSDAIRHMMKNDPSKFVMACVQLMPKQQEIGEAGAFDELSDKELDDFIKDAQHKLKQLAG